jgi:hypothetical protein
LERAVKKTDMGWRWTSRPWLGRKQDIDSKVWETTKGDQVTKREMVNAP